MLATANKKKIIYWEKSEKGIQAGTLGIPKGAYRIVLLGHSGLHRLFVIYINTESFISQHIQQ